MIVDEIKLMLENHKEKTNVFKIGYVKEFLQTYILKQIYEYSESKDLIFYGGTAMRFLLGLNRLSEDLDFVSKNFDDFEGLGKHLTHYFGSNNLLVDFKIQKFRITLKFRGLLSQLGMHYDNSYDLYVKIEISDNIGFLNNYEIKMYPIFKYNQSLVLPSLDSSTLFASKLNAVLYRNREKKKGDKIITAKGRDFYDLFWYISNGYHPNIDSVKGIENMNDLKNNLIDVVDKLDFSVIVEDIKSFVEDENMIQFFIHNAKSRIIEKVSGW